MKKVTPHLFASFVTIAILGSSYFYFNAGTSCTYRIRGNLKVRTQLGAEISPGFENTVLPLKGVKVRVKGRSSTALPWSNWGEVQTDENGYFNITRQKSGSACSYGRHIKVDAKFVSNRMEIARGGLVDEWGTFPDWYRFAGKRTTGGLRRAGNPRENLFDREVPKYTQIGNAVPPILGEYLGKEIVNSIS